MPDLSVPVTPEDMQFPVLETPRMPLPDAPPAADAQDAAREEELSQASLLVMLAEEEAELFHTPGGEAYAAILVQDRPETWPVRSKEFRHWLARRFYRGGGQVPRGQSLNDALTVVEGLALDEGPEHPVFLRKAEHAGALYLDLANEGWEVCSEAPVRFRRAEGMLPLPAPVHGGTIDALRPFVNVAGEDDFRLLVMRLLAALGPSQPYPLLGLHGEQGSARRTTARVLRALVDPHQGEPCRDPRRPRDLACLADSSLVVVLENLRALPEGLADALSCLTAGGVSTPHPNAGEATAILQKLRPVLWTGLGEFAPAADQVDRTLTLRLPPMAAEERRTEAEFWGDFWAACPGILGALLDGVAAGLRYRAATRLDRLPRVADFVCWGSAAERGLGWKAGTFLAAYQANRGEATDEALHAFPMAEAILRLVADEGEWLGTCRELLPLLVKRAAEDGQERQDCRGRRRPSHTPCGGCGLIWRQPAWRSPSRERGPPVWSASPGRARRTEAGPPPMTVPPRT